MKNEKFTRPDSNLFQTKGDLFQKSLRQAPDFYKGMAKYKYESLWSFIIGSLMAELFIFLGLLFSGLLVISTISLFEGEISEVSLAGIMGKVVTILIVCLLFFFGYKISKRLIDAFKERNKEFKKKAILLLIPPTFLAIFVLISLYIALLSFGFVY